MAQQFTATGLALGGASGVRFSQRSGFTVSRNTLLRLVRKMPLPLIDFLETLGVDDFASVVRQRQPEQLDSWMTQAENSILSHFRRFAKSLREDYDAVKAGVTLSVSNGPVEGHINRLKMLKRLSLWSRWDRFT